MTDLIETVADTIEPEAKAKKTKAIEKAAYSTDDVPPLGVSNERIIGKLKEELSTLEARQELYRQVVGPDARTLIHNWKTFLEAEERTFLSQLIRLHQDKMPPYINLASDGAAFYFNKEAILDKLPALAFSIAGPSAMQRYNRNDHYYPVVPRIHEIREELERLEAA